MNKLKLIISFILLVSLFLGVVACTPDEESKAESSADVSEDVSETVSEDEPDVSIDENIFRIRNQLKPYGHGEIILVDKYKGDRKLYMVTLSTSDSLIDDNKVIADAFYDEYGLTFSEAFEKYCDDPEDHEKCVEAFEKIEADVSLLLPDFKEKMLNELKSIHNVDNIILDERLIEDLADVVVTEPEKGVQEALLDYETVCRADGMSMVRIHLHTGRTHQIRVQFSSRGFPLVGERKYCEPMDDCPLALWSHKIGFTHPKSGEPMCFEKYPPDIAPWDKMRR